MNILKKQLSLLLTKTRLRSQEIQEKDEKLMCFQEQEERLQQLEKELSELLQILPIDFNTQTSSSRYVLPFLSQLRNVFLEMVMPISVSHW